ncbi:HlyD family efflux transporter periplasmic adaptor subunit [Mucilaginibacter rubeus]|uniref:HlyD family efflux transporter periplasmic adaptor subunit n=1 Tax=Mucilaginibacter rubeus TaxID=2027860 RepID=A0ABX7U620_9SPHI|nr:HlyD family efflux transporter periplasmic adaptor subunit [Mucilaginibacter gossypii]QTE48186.1 HlyD family efflux transporter periplasmic adaptor subunit [Mucilaginibacter rubeus]
MSGIIDSVYFKDGDAVKQGQVIVKLKDLVTGGKKLMNQFEIDQRQKFIHDLVLLSDTNKQNERLTEKLNSPLYKEQLSKYYHELIDQRASLKKANKELELYKSLFDNKVITPKEFFDIQIQAEKANASYSAFRQQQLSLWDQDLTRNRMELNQYSAALLQVKNDATFYFVKSPLDGVIQGLNTKYSGGSLSLNDVLCSISPNGDLIGECYVSTADIGLIKKNQDVSFQIDAFNYNYFGMLKGKVLAVDNDYLVVDNKPIFKVRCLFLTTNLLTKNNFAAQLKKGYTFQARFLVGRRSLWQLMFDKVNDWLNPAAPDQTQSNE